MQTSHIRSPGRLLCLALLVPLALLASLLLVGKDTAPVAAQSEPPTSAPAAMGTMQLPPAAQEASAVPAVARLSPKKADKMDTALAELAATANQKERSAARLQEQAQEYGLPLDGERVQIQLVIDGANQELVTQAVDELGGQITGSIDGGALLQGWLPASQLNALAARPEVHYIRQPIPAVLLDTTGGDYETEALDDMNVQSWHSAGWRGQNVKVGIIDGGFTDYPDLLGSELPATIVAKNFVDNQSDADVDGTTKHGTAVAEIIHDIAPNARLYIAKVATNIDLQEATAWLRDVQKVDLISTSLGWYNLTPGDGTGQFADLVAQTRAAGTLWMTAAGNDRESHWGGLYEDPDDDDFLDFAPNQEVDYFGPGNGSTYIIPPGLRISIYVRWNDWSDVDQDYDLFAVRWNGSESSWQIVAASRNAQDGQFGQQPTEQLFFTTSGDPAPYGFLIQRYRADPAQPANFEIFIPKFLRPDEIVTARSLANLADAPQALTVAAVDAAIPYPQEPYSAEGPTNGPGGSQNGGFTKPDLAAYANVSTASFGTSDRFNGTSAATPHVTGAAALVLSAYPQASAGDIQSFLETRAIDMGPSGKDTDFGQGRLYLAAAPPNLIDSRMEITPHAVSAGDVVTYTLRLVNSGGVTTTATLENPLPDALVLGGRPQISGGERPLTPTQTLNWSGPISPTATVTIVYTGTLQANPGEPLRVINWARVQDHEGRTTDLVAALNPIRIFLPAVVRED